jgi:hypothetical protein
VPADLEGIRRGDEVVMDRLFRDEAFQAVSEPGAEYGILAHRDVSFACGCFSLV